MKIKRIPGNITLLALFVLLASALIGVLVALFMRNFFRYSDEITTYEKTNYLAKAGTELGLAMLGSRGIGFSSAIKPENVIMQNFSCPFEVKEGAKCPQEPHFSLTIAGLTETKSVNPRISDSCEKTENFLEVKPGLSVIIPLFYDKGGESIHDNLKKAKNLILQSLNALEMKGKGTWKFGVMAFDERNHELSLRSWEGGISAITQGSLFNGQENFLIIANPSTSQTQSLCIQRKNGPLPQETVKIVSIGFFKNRQLGTETLATKKLPEFLQGDNYLKGDALNN